MVTREQAIYICFALGLVLKEPEAFTNLCGTYGLDRLKEAANRLLEVNDIPRNVVYEDE